MCWQCGFFLFFALPLDSTLNIVSCLSFVCFSRFSVVFDVRWSKNMRAQILHSSDHKRICEHRTVAHHKLPMYQVCPISRSFSIAATNETEAWSRVSDVIIESNSIAVCLCSPCVRVTIFARTRFMLVFQFGRYFLDVAIAKANDKCVLRTWSLYLCCCCCYSVSSQFCLRNCHFGNWKWLFFYQTSINHRTLLFEE